MAYLSVMRRCCHLAKGIKQQACSQQLQAAF